MKKFFRRLTETQFMLLCFIPFGGICFYLNGLAGLLAAIVGWCLGDIIWKNKKAIRNFNYEKFFRRYRVELLALLILIPVDALACHFGGWKIFAAVTIGWLLGIALWRIGKRRR